MVLPEEVEEYIKETIQESLGLPVSTQTLQMKLRASEESLRSLHNKHLLLLERLRRKDHLIDQAKAEASMNAVSLKKFVEENQRLAAECANLVNQCNKWERECSLYDHDREALMEFGNEADERAKEAETRVCELEVELGKVLEELEFYRQKYADCRIDSSAEGIDVEEHLLESILVTLISTEEAESGLAFLEANSGHEPCKSLMKMWNSLRPSSHRVLSLAAKFKALQEDKEHLRINLARAEEEVKLLFEENKILDAENKKLLRRHHRDQNLDSSDGNHANSASSKRNKRKSSPKIGSPDERKVDFKDLDTVRAPLSPLRLNSPDIRMHD